MNDIQANSTPNDQSSCGSRLIATLVATHLALRVLASAAVSQFGLPLPNNAISVAARFAVSGLFGLLIGQVVLVLCWGAFAGQRWFPRIPRFGLLVAWLFMTEVLGTYLVEGDIVRTIIEELTAHQLLMVLPPFLFLVAWGFFNRRRFLPSFVPQSAVYQFSSQQLFLIIAEIAALLALGRVVLNWSQNGAEQFWTGLTGNRPEELISIAFCTVVLPAVFYGLASRRSWSGLLILTLYLAIPSFFMAWTQTSFQSRTIIPALAWDAWPILLIEWLDFFAIHAFATATILFTFYLLRRIGYDFRRRDEAPLFRCESNANSSAASASA